VVDLIVDPAVSRLVPVRWRRKLHVEVARMATAAARTDRRDDYEVSLRLVDDPTIHVLNRNYRKKDRPTDVLAFAQREGPGPAAVGDVLGDLVISVETARRQAKRGGATGLHAELRFLAAHGLCHLLGYDHRTDREEREMNDRMAELLAEAGRRGSIKPA
jgi:probable rRNA maturation factor